MPYTRGEEISRPFDDVLVEVAQLAEQGVREVNLLGQNVNAYRGPMHDGGIADLALLIHAIAQIDGIGRIRFTTSHPLEFSDSLIEAYANVPQLANYLHLPVQSGSRPNPGGDEAWLHRARVQAASIRKLRAVRPDISISSDFIVGFPGETDADFEQTMKLIDDIGFDQSFSFIYSRRPGTPAANLPDDTTDAVKQRTPARLQAAHQRQRRSDREGHGRHGADGAGRGPRARRARTKSPAAPRTCATSISPATRALMGQFVDVRDHPGHDQLAARTRAPGRRPAGRLNPRISKKSVVIAAQAGMTPWLHISFNAAVVQRSQRLP